MTADAIVKTVTVPLPPDRAFRLFTQGMSDWWPLDSHSLSARDGAPAASVTVTPGSGVTVTEAARCTRPGPTVPPPRGAASPNGRRAAPLP